MRCSIFIKLQCLSCIQCSELSRSHFASKVVRDGVASKLSIVDLAGSFVSFAHAMVLRCSNSGANMCQFNADTQSHNTFGYFCPKVFPPALLFGRFRVREEDLHAWQVKCCKQRDSRRGSGQWSTPQSTTDHEDPKIQTGPNKEKKSKHAAGRSSYLNIDRISFPLCLGCIIVPSSQLTRMRQLELQIITKVKVERR